MSNLRVTVSFGDDPPSVERQSEILDELGRTMREGMGKEQRLMRLPALQLPGAAGASQPPAEGSEEMALRVFMLELPDGADANPIMRAVGGWYMRYPHLTVTIKADGPRGGTSLKLTGFSTVAFARATSQIAELMRPEEE